MKNKRKYFQKKGAQNFFCAPFKEIFFLRLKFNQLLSSYSFAGIYLY